MDVITLGLTGLAAALCAVVVRQRAPELAMAVGIGACALLLRQILPVLETMREELEELARTAEVDPALLRPVFQTVGISLVTRLTTALCRDAGENGVAVLLEIAGSAAAAAAALPLLGMVFQMISGLL